MFEAPSHVFECDSFVAGRHCVATYKITVEDHGVVVSRAHGRAWEHVCEYEFDDYESPCTPGPIFARVQGEIEDSAAIDGESDDLSYAELEALGIYEDDDIPTIDRGEWDW